MGDRFIGRDAELTVAHGLIDRARAGRPHPLVITGASGTGKSMLLQRIATQAAGFRVLEVRGEAVVSDTPHGSLHEAALLWPGMDVEPTHAELIAVLHRAVRSPLPSGQVLTAFRHLLEALEFRGPVLVAVDDLHLIDPRSTQLLLYLARTMRRRRVMFALTLRTETPVDADVLADVWRERESGRIDVVELGPFDDDELAALVVARTGRTPDATLVGLLRGQTDGMPFFASELVRAVAERGLLELPDGRITTDLVELPLPTQVRTAVVHRVFLLGPDARRVASTLAVLGPIGTDRLGVLSAATGLTSDRTDDAFDRLVRAHVVVADGRVYRFAHAIVREALQADLGPATTRSMHAAIARVLVDERDAGAHVDVVALAEHLVRGSNSHDHRSVRLLLDAGDRTVDTEPDKAVRWYRESLARLPPDDPLVVTTQVRLGRALVRAGFHDEALKLTTALLAVLAAGPLRAQAVIVAGHALGGAGRFDEAGALLDDALDDVRTRNVHLALHRAQLHTFTAELDRMDRRLADAVAMGCPDDHPIVLALRMHAAASTGRFSTAHALAGALRSRARDGADVPLLQAICLITGVNFDPAMALRIAEAGGTHGPDMAWFHAASSWAHLRLGQLDAAIASATAAAEAGDGRSGALLRRLYLPILVLAHAERGDLPAARAAADRATWPTGGVFDSGITVARARLCSITGDHQRANALLGDAVERERALGRINTQALALAEQVDAADLAGDTATAHSASTRLQQLPRDDTAIAMNMWCLLAEATVRRSRDEAERAHEHAQRHGLRLDAARALALAGGIAGDGDVLVVAHDAFADLGALTRQRRVAQQLRTLGRRAPPSRRTGGLLTAVETEVAAHVAAGLTNRKVAERMNLSPKTIEVYLSRIYAKTGCRSRVDLAVAVRAGTLRSAT